MKEKSIWKIHKKQIWFLTGALILSACALFYWFRRQADQKPEVDGVID